MQQNGGSAQLQVTPNGPGQHNVAISRTNEGAQGSGNVVQVTVRTLDGSPGPTSVALKGAIVQDVQGTAVPLAPLPQSTVVIGP
jgi:hypothetical protein